jgi:hypothetical protein
VSAAYWAERPAARREYRDGYVRACRLIGIGDGAAGSAFDQALDGGPVALLAALASLTGVAAAPGSPDRREGAARAAHHLARAALQAADGAA